MNTSTATIGSNEVQRIIAAISNRKTRTTASRRSRLLLAALAAAALSAAALALNSYSHAQTAAAEGTTEPQPALRSVSVVRPVRDMKQNELLLPAEVLAYQTTSIHARIGGYLKAWHVDRGARVKAGETLAEIDAPEFDQGLRQARSELDESKAQLEQARAEKDQTVANLAATHANVLKAEASLDLAAKTVERFKDLEEKWAATRQQYDEAVRNHEAARAELTAAKANVSSAEATVATRAAAIRTAEAHVASLNANVRRLEETEIFKTIVAPFDGIVTRRNADVGALVPADGSRELFSLAQDQVLRVTANVPQAYAALIRAGQSADVVAREFTAGNIAAKVARTAGAIDPVARTLTVELELPNADHKLLPGAFTQVRFLVQDTLAAVRIPSSTLRFTKEGAQVVSMDADGRLQVKPVKLGRDDGAQVEVLSGLTGAEALVVNPTDSMTAGERVQVAGDKPLEVAAK